MHGCEHAPAVCAAQTGHAHVPEVVVLALALAAVLAVARLARA